jgi:2-polyprenyl-3-methyl-5-hydroxy-6-metoxy-1,4-benzoquinol methylase
MTPDHDHFQKLIAERSERFPSMTLPPEFAELFEINTLQLMVKLARYKFVARLLKASDNVLEVGSGSGIGSIFISQHAKHVTALESTKREWEYACSLNRRSNVKFLNQSFFEFGSGESYDAVLALDVIEHFDVEGGHKLVKKMADHCATNGIVFVGTPSIYSFPHQGTYSQAAHIHCYDQAELTVLMDNYFGRTIAFSMSDEIVHTGHPKMAWYYFVLGFNPRRT